MKQLSKHMHHKLCSGEWGLDSNTKTQKCARGYLISLLLNALMQKLDGHNIDIFNHSMVYIYVDIGIAMDMHGGQLVKVDPLSRIVLRSLLEYQQNKKFTATT